LCKFVFGYFECVPIIVLDFYSCPIAFYLYFLSVLLYLYKDSVFVKRIVDIFW